MYNLVEEIRDIIRDISEIQYGEPWYENIEYIVFYDVFFKPNGAELCSEAQAILLRELYIEAKEWAVYDSSLVSKYWESCFEEYFNSKQHKQLELEF